MKYDEDLLVELIACAELSHAEIAGRVGVSRRTVWRIANGRSRPDLQQKIADTVEGFRRATVRLAARRMKAVLTKHVEVTLEGDGEIARRCREFLLKTFMLALPAQAAAKTPKPPPPAMPTDRMLTILSPGLKDMVIAELGGPTGEDLPPNTPKDQKDQIAADIATGPDILPPRDDVD